MNKRLSVVACAERHRFEPRSPTSTYFILLFSVTARFKLSGNERNGLSMVTWPLVVSCVVTDRVTTKLLPLHSWKNKCTNSWSSNLSSDWCARPTDHWSLNCYNYRRGKEMCRLLLLPYQLSGCIESADWRLLLPVPHFRAPVDMTGPTTTQHK